MDKLTSTKLRQKAQGYKLAAFNAHKKEQEILTNNPKTKIPTPKKSIKTIKKTIITETKTINL